MSEESKTIVRSRRCGLKDIYLAKVKKNEAGAYETDTPTKFARAIGATVTDNYNSEKVYSDDGTEEVITSYQGTDVELEVNTLAPQDRALVWDRLYQEGFLVEAAEDEPTELALGFRTRQLNGKYEFVWYYCGKFDQGQEEEYQTIEDKKNPKTATITASFYERAKADTLADQNTGEQVEKHLIRIRVDESNLAQGEEDAANAIKNWFSKVQEYQTGATETPTGAAETNGEGGGAA